jgi:polysaccharide biosynthesis protein PslH
LHILLISRCPPYPLHLGDRLIVWHLVRELKKLGVTFDLIALTQKPSDMDEEHHYAHLFNKITLIRKRRARLYNICLG